MCKLKEILFSGYGFLTEETLSELKEIMGENFEIIARTYEHGRMRISIKKFESLESEMVDDIRDVFIPADTYNTLKSLI